MNYFRSSLFWRNQSQENEAQDLERHAPSQVQLEPQATSRSFTFSPRHLSSLFTVRPSEPRGRQPNLEEDADSDDGPKSPAPRLGIPFRGTSANRFRLSSLSRTHTQDNPAPRLFGEIQSANTPNRFSLPHIQTQRFPVIAQPPPARTTGEDLERQAGSTTFHGADPAELHLAELAETGRRRRRRHHRHHRHHRRAGENADSSRRHRHRPREHRDPPKRFLYCFPWVKSRRVRSAILRCFVSGIFLISMLAIYLSLSLTKNISSNEFSILLILLILLTTIFFCHGLVRLCILLVRPKTERGSSNTNGVEAAGYAVPRQPIRVVLARDEEAAGIESEATKTQPPAYGLWRESVRVDPNRLFWQRAEPAEPLAEDENGEEERPQRRPPSYISDDGVDYIVDARPRSVAPPPSSVYSQPSAFPSPMTTYTSDVPLPMHPAEIEAARRMQVRVF
ncbi:hypothetical protein F5Y16DRAFT_240770 [Xylariaceae sp. FL0255]|nr:hypothetical protein F5Y16DRAFT_240770 [Xylariaceae sp. FL0255]